MRFLAESEWAMADRVVRSRESCKQSPPHAAGAGGTGSLGTTPEEASRQRTRADSAVADFLDPGLDVPIAEIPLGNLAVRLGRCLQVALDLQGTAVPVEHLLG